jgi:hypothetical protein
LLHHSGPPKGAPDLCGHGDAVGARLPRVPFLLDVTVAEDALLLDRHHPDFGALEDGRGGYASSGAFFGVRDDVFGRAAAADAGEVAGIHIVSAVVDDARRGRGSRELIAW